MVCFCVQNGGRVPFLRWDMVKNSSNLSLRVALYYLETARGQQVITALAIRGEDNRLVYQPFGQFIEGYQDLLNLGHVTGWNYRFQTLRRLGGFLALTADKFASVQSSYTSHS